MTTTRVRVLLDQGLPRDAAEQLRATDVKCQHVGEIGMSAASDTEILDYARATDSIVVTLDADFYAILVVSGMDRLWTGHCGRLHDHRQAAQDDLPPPALRRLNCCSAGWTRRLRQARESAEQNYQFGSTAGAPCAYYENRTLERALLPAFSVQSSLVRLWCAFLGS